MSYPGRPVRRPRKWTERGAIFVDRRAGVSRGHIRREKLATRKDAHGRIRNPVCKSKEQEPETLGLNESDLMLSDPLKARTVEVVSRPFVQCE